MTTGSDTMEPWYSRTLRWGQTNLTEVDPVRYDDKWWRSYWRRTKIQGVIVNAGGIVAYYPSRYPLQHRAEYLGDGDLYGDIVGAAREEGLVVVARMDSNRAEERFYMEHPDWFAIDADGVPYKAGELYVSCVSSPYYDEYLPLVLTEIIERSQPDGFADNSWSGLDRNSICYCANCRRRFRDDATAELPRRVDWSDPTYRRWITWSYARRVEIWDRNNEITKKAGGPDCLWLGMNAGDVQSESARLRDVKAIAERAPIFMLDAQWRHGARGFEDNANNGKLLHGLMGWDKLIPESTAQYNAGDPTFRLGSKPEPEMRLWALEGFAGGIQPWWHHIGAYHEDRRQYRMAERLFAWHAANEKYLTGRRPTANVGVVWSQANTDFYGRDDADLRTGSPFRGFVKALIRSRIPYVPVHADHISRDADGLAVLVLPNVGALTDEQCEAVRAFVRKGGGLVATGESSLYNGWGDRREDFGLADVLGAHATGAHHGFTRPVPATWESWSRHSYLRLAPEIRAGVDGPNTGREPVLGVSRHAVLSGFEETDTLPFAGRLEVVVAIGDVEAPAVFIPPFPIYPPEKSWMAVPSTAVPAVLLGGGAGEGRVAYLPADLDRCFERDGQPDHGQLLANAVRWAAKEPAPVEIDGPGRLDCSTYSQDGRVVIHLVNLTGVPAKGPIDAFVPVGPLQVRARIAGLPSAPQTARLLVAGATVAVTCRDGEAAFDVPSVEDHEVVVLE